jgi:hypothetical protein
MLACQAQVSTKGFFHFRLRETPANGKGGDGIEAVE